MQHRSVEISPPRTLMAEERAALDYLLSADFPGQSMLLKQAESVRVSEECEDCKVSIP